MIELLGTNVAKSLRALTPPRGWPVLLWLGVAAALTGGCAGPDVESKSDRLDEFLQTPAFLASPVMALLTNTDGFSARVELGEPGAKLKKGRTGVLIGRGNRLFYAPDPASGLLSKRHENERATFLWDVSEGKGYVMNEALQGYAPISCPAKILLVSTNGGSGGSVFETVDGHRCRRVDVSIGLSDGSSMACTTWRATDLKGFPVRIKSSNGQLTLNFSKVRLESSPAELFLLPSGFSKFSSPEVMTGELLERELRLKNKEPGAWNRSETELQGAPGRGPRNPYGPQ